jgi:hypothetical protein
MGPSPRFIGTQRRPSVCIYVLVLNRHGRTAKMDFDTALTSGVGRVASVPSQ